MPGIEPACSWTVCWVLNPLNHTGTPPIFFIDKVLPCLNTPAHGRPFSLWGWALPPSVILAAPPAGSPGAWWPSLCLPEAERSRAEGRGGRHNHRPYPREPGMCISFLCSLAIRLPGTLIMKPCLLVVATGFQFHWLWNLEQHEWWRQRTDFWLLRRRGRDWEFRVSRCKLLHLEWISNEILLYSTGNCVWSLVMEHDGG